MSPEELRNRLDKLYDLYRTTLLSRKYYGCRLQELRNLNLAMEVSIAVGSSSAIAAWGIWGLNRGSTAWATIAGFSTLLAVLKPVLQLPKDIERYSKLQVGYSDVYYDLKQSIETIGIEEDLSPAIHEGIVKAQKRFRELSLDDDPKPRRSLVLRCQREVEAEIPISSLPKPRITSLIGKE